MADSTWPWPTGQAWYQACSVPELVEQVSWGRRTKAKGGALGLGFAGPPGLSHDSPLTVTVVTGHHAFPHVGDQGCGGEGYPKNLGVPLGRPISDPFPTSQLATTPLKGQKLI